MQPIFDEIDIFDERIMAALAEDGRMSITALSERVGLSKTPCHQRIRRLVEAGYIEGFRAILNPGKLGLEHIAFVEVKLSDTREAALSAFNDAVRNLREVEECHMIAGRFDYLLKVRTASIAAYRRVLGDSISKLPFVANTSTSVAMEAIKDRGY